MAECACRMTKTSTGLCTMFYCPMHKAAPDLLEACQAFVEAWEKSLQLEKTDVALRKARAAIANATKEAENG